MTYSQLREKIINAGYFLERGMWGHGVSAMTTWEIRRNPEDEPPWESSDFVDFNDKVDALHAAAKQAERRWGVPIFS